MKSVLISIRPKWCEKICHEIGKDENGKSIYEKRIEVRKTAPKEVPFKAYIYETYDKKYADIGICWRNGKTFEHGCKKVIGEFVCDEVYEYTFSHYEAEYRVTHVEQEAMRLNQPKLIQYGKGKTLYGWHISDLKIYDVPKELSEFKTPPCEKSEKACGNCKWLVKINTPDIYECECYVEDGRPITRPPQSYMFVREL